MIPSSASSIPPEQEDIRNKTIPPRQRQNRKARSQVAVPADTLLTFTRYNPTRSVQRNYHHISQHAHPRTQTRRRENFVQANYRFAVDPTNPATLQTAAYQPNAIIPWPCIDLVCVSCPTSTCPICLQTLRCARITPCGHVFDYVCILQHVSQNGDEQRCSAKCPICSNPIFPADLKACTFRDVDVLQVGLPCVLRLVSRQRGSMLAILHCEGTIHDVPRYMSEHSPLYSRFAFAEKSFLLQVVTESIADLRNVLREDPAVHPFADLAMANLKAEKRAIRSRKSDAGCGTLNDSPGATQSVSTNDSGLRKDPWFFYQARDTQNVFLHPVNHRCLATEFEGRFENATSEISGDVLQIERHTMNEVLRKKYRFLEHLPDGCEFAFVELDLSSTVSPHTIAVHYSSLRERKAARKRKEMKTRREDQRLEKKKSESLQEYFSTGSGSLLMPVQQHQSVDSRDANSFPALRTDGRPSSETIEIDSEATGAQIGTVATPGGSWGGTEISSYSSVTANMGLFPTLGQTVEMSDFPRPGAAMSSLQPGRPKLLRGVWGSSSNVGPPPAPEESRQKKKSSGKTKILLSNAGTPYRR